MDDLSNLSTITSGIDTRELWGPSYGALVVLRGREPVNELTLVSNKTLKVGRAEGCELRLRGDLEVAREHGSIRHVKGDVWELTDFGSKNATYVNGKLFTGGPLAHAGKVLVVRMGGSIILLGDWQWYERAKFSFGDEVFVSPRLGQAHRFIEAAAAAGRTVVVQAETGAGKEYACQVIYRDASRTGRGPMVSVNCANLNAETAASEIFGYVKGAFTGAVRDHAGYFEQAEGGILYLDEIGTLQHDTQARLLRVIQDKVVTRLGSEKGRKLNVHIVCATNEDLAVAVARGTFREDLYMRLKAGIIALPPLRERPEEIPFIIKKYCGELGIAPDFVEDCLKYDWPGNVRELIAVVEAAADRVRVSGGRSLTAEDFRAVIGEPVAVVSAATPGEVTIPKARKPRDAEKFATFERVRDETGSIGAAREAAGISVSTAYEWGREIDAKRRR